MEDNCSVQVAVRIRPLIPSEVEKRCQSVIRVIPDLQQVQIADRAFTYNHVIDSDTNQDVFYALCIENKIKELFKGYNVTVLAYGQTGSGKTYTMGTTYSEDGDQNGVIPRAMNQIFNICRDNFLYDFTISVSFTELYQEVLYDLLAEKPREQTALDIREDAKGATVLPGVQEVVVNSPQEALKCLMRGSLRRATSATNMNLQSSRSHAIFTINIAMENKKETNQNKTAKFHIVDLAGSERPKKTGAVGQTFREGININKGLLILGNVICALADDKGAHVPYRDSNLTRLLKDSLGGNSITLMVACVSPADYNVEETLSTLRYADRARRIKNKPVVNQDPKVAEINRLNKLVQQLRLELVGQGGPIICQAELDKLKSQNEQLKSRNVDLTVKLSCALTSNTALLEKFHMIQDSNEKLQEKLQQLKQQYNTTLDELNENLENNNTVEIKEKVRALALIQEQLTEIDKEQRNNDNELRQHDIYIGRDSGSSKSGNQTTDNEIQEKQEQHTAQQVAMSTELQELMRNLAMKEHLAQQMLANTNHMVDDKLIRDHEAKIVALEKEKEELINELKKNGGNNANMKVVEHRRKQIQDLEGQIQTLRKKVQEQGRLIKLKEKDEIKIKELNREIVQMKQAKVRLIREMRQESERFRVWKIQRDRDVIKLQQQDRKRQNEMMKMKVLHDRQHNVLKRKMEEVAAVNKRLKDALTVKVATQDARKAGKIDKLDSWLHQEIELVSSIIEAQASLSFLMEDRANLNDQLAQLKAVEEPTNEDLIRQIESDIETRSAQITDLNQKILDFDEENKAKVRWESIQSMSDAKFALKKLFEFFCDTKHKEASKSSTILELQCEISELKKQLAERNLAVQDMERRFKEDIAEINQQAEEKITVLLHQLRGIELKSVDEQLKQRCEIQQNTIDKLEEELAKSKEKWNELSMIVEVHKQNAIKDTNINMESSRDGNVLKEIQNKSPILRSPSPVVNHINTRKVQLKVPELDTSCFIDDDLEKDPSWRNTPLARKVYSARQMHISNLEKPMKRSADGGCMCKTNCSSRLCGCRKTSKQCGEACKCAVMNCQNREVPNTTLTVSSDDPERETSSIEQQEVRLKRRRV